MKLNLNDNDKRMLHDADIGFDEQNDYSHDKADEFNESIFIKEAYFAMFEQDHSITEEKHKEYSKLAYDYADLADKVQATIELADKYEERYSLKYIKQFQINYISNIEISGNMRTCISIEYSGIDFWFNVEYAKHAVIDERIYDVIGYGMDAPILIIKEIEDSESLEGKSIVFMSD